MIKNILLITLLLFLFSCNSGIMNSDDSNETVADVNSPEYEYIQLQVKMHRAYTLLKAFNSGVLTQEEYDKLKKELI
tara:strand:- start:226 stop:456 length:231 start_codon:yes stop_codon:yes gene_type:complete